MIAANHPVVGEGLVAQRFLFEETSLSLIFTMPPASEPASS
jgi:hypothetical protein